MKKDKNNRRNNGPEHISFILREAKKEMMKQRVEDLRTLPEFKEVLDQAPFLQPVFLYIDGDPQYIRLINLN